MSALSIQVPFPVFQGRDGQPLENGYIWIGEPNLNPQTNPVVAYYDEALTIVAPQPLRTLNGYVSRAGTPAQIYVDGANYSILVQDSKGSMVYNFPDGTGLGPDATGVAFTGFKGQVGFVSDLADDDGSDLIGFQPSGSGAVARSAQDKMRDTVSVKDFDAVGNGVADDTAAIQAAIDAVYAASNAGGDVFFPVGTYLITATLTLKAGVCLTGSFGNQGANNCRILARTLNGPLLINDPNNSVNGQPSPQNGDDGFPKRVQGSVLSNLFFDQRTTTSPDCDALRFQNMWQMTIQNCAIRAYAGFSIRSLDCNVQHFHDNFMYGGVFCESMTDSIWMDNEIGPSSYPSLDNDAISSNMWISGGQSSGIGQAWLATISNNLIFNAGAGVAKSCTVTSGVQNIACTSHGYTDGTPVIYESTGTAGLNLTYTYYVKVVNANTVNLATSRLNLNNGTFVTPSATGTGTQVLRIGAATNLFANNGTRNYIFSNNRFDQAVFANVDYRGTRNNTLIGNNIIMAGRTNAVGQPGVRLASCSDELIVGNMIDGQIFATYPFGVSKQSVGVSIDSASVKTKITGNKIINHSVANISNSSITTLLDLDSIFVSPYTFIARFGTPVLTGLTGNRRQVWAMDSTSTEAITAYVSFPSNDVSNLGWTPTVFVTNLGAGSGGVVINTQIEEFADNADMSVNETAYTASETVTVGAQNILKTAIFSPYTGENLKIASVTLQRVPSDAGDTLPNDAGLAGVLFTPNV